jgi:hypothetical protein
MSPLSATINKTGSLGLQDISPDFEKPDSIAFLQQGSRTGINSVTREDVCTSDSIMGSREQ